MGRVWLPSVCQLALPMVLARVLLLLLMPMLVLELVLI